MARTGFVLVSETLEEADRPLLSVAVAVNVLLPALVPRPTMNEFVHTFDVLASNTIAADELPPMALASKVTFVTAPLPSVVVTLMNVLWFHVNAVGIAVVTEVGGVLAL